jgi:hypothetical protein
LTTKAAFNMLARYNNQKAHDFADVQTLYNGFMSGR